MKKTVWILSLLVMFSLNLQTVSACGPFTTDPYFELTKHPDYPLEKYTSGNIGIIKPTFARSYLFAAYKQLNDGKFSPEESRNLNEYWVYRIEAEYSNITDKKTLTIEEAIDKWFESRRKVAATGKPEDFSNEKESGSEEYSSYTNCLPDSFDNASKTLEKRISKYGKDSADVKNWVDGQNAVFANCGGKPTAVPTVNADAAKWLVKDRDYQTAAGHFYAGEMESARAGFEKIAAEGDSEWQKTANFVVARTYIREGGSAKDENKIKTARENAVAQLQKIIADSRMSEFHLSAERLLNFVNDRLAPQKRLAELPRKLLANGNNQNLQWEVNDYTKLLDAIKTTHDENAQKTEAADANAENKETYDYYQNIYFKFLPAAAHADDLTDWIFTFQSTGADANQYALEKWQGTHKIQWLLAAISKADKNSSKTAELIADADKIPSSSTAYTNAAYHEIRLLLEQNKRGEAKKKLLEVFNANFKEYPVSTQNQFIEQRAAVAENLEEYLKFATRRAAEFVDSDDGNQAPVKFVDEKGKPFDSNISAWQNRQMFDTDAVKFLNTKVPLSVLRQAALSRELPEYLRKFLVIAVWTRAFILRNAAVEREFAPLVLKLAPEFQPFFSKYVNAADATERESAALLAVLNYPKLDQFVETGYGRDDGSEPGSIDSLRGNWWCAEFKTGDQVYADAAEEKYVDAQIYPAFLSAAQNSEAETEQNQLKTTAGSSSTYLARRAVVFASANPKHPNTPEILHLSVRATRYGCSDENTGKASKAAFTLLHQTYPNSPWTKKTPYYFQ